MLLQKSIRILGKDYEVEYCDLRKEKESSASSRGYVCTGEQIIRIDNHNSKRQTQEETLLHEIIHALSDALGADLDEKQVNLMGAGLYQVINDNGLLG